DDRTREAVAYVLGRKLIFKQELMALIEKRFRRRGLEMPAINKKQAYLIEGAETLANKNGTAPGLWLETESKVIILLPGPPQELKPMFESDVWPRLQKFKIHFTARATLKTAGLTESQIESLISDLYPKFSKVKVTTLAYPGQIEINLHSISSRSQYEADKNLNKLQTLLLQKLKDNVFSTDGQELEEVVGKLLRHHSKKLSVAESCSGGLLGHRLTNVPGSSDYFLLGVIAYSNQAKISLLDVPADLIAKYGAVSPQVAQAMAEGVRKKAQAEIGLGITGIAGPSGGTAAKPVGLVYVALSAARESQVSKNLFLGQREAVKFQSTQKALDMLRYYLLKFNLTNQSK
ncbi:MAG: CinA family nicotinamide mononucleotide deamidase-related protein, partial [Candidatus Aminicenantales bacterium]